MKPFLNCWICVYTWVLRYMQQPVGTYSTEHPEDVCEMVSGQKSFSLYKAFFHLCLFLTMFIDFWRTIPHCTSLPFLSLFPSLATCSSANSIHSAYRLISSIYSEWHFFSPFALALFILNDHKMNQKCYLTQCICYIMQCHSAITVCFWLCYLITRTVNPTKWSHQQHTGLLGIHLHFAGSLLTYFPPEWIWPAVPPITAIWSGLMNLRACLS